MDRQAEIRRLQAEIAQKQRQLEGLTQSSGPAARQQPAKPKPAPRDAAALRFSVIGVVFLMGLAIAALVGLQDAAPWQKLVVGGAMAAGLVVMGWVGRHRHRALSELLLGAGLAACYLAAYAVFSAAAGGGAAWTGTVVWPLAASCVVVFAIAAHGRGSRTAAAIGMVFVYYSVFAAAFFSRTDAMLAYALATSGAIALSVLGLSLFRPWRFLHAAVLVLNGLLLFAVFDAARWFPGQAPLPPLWVGVVAGVQYVAFGLADAFDERRGRRRFARLLAGLNIAVHLVWILRAVAAWAPESMAGAELVLAAVSFLLAAASYWLANALTRPARLYGAAAIVLAAGTAWELLPLTHRGPVYACIALLLAAFCRGASGRTLVILQAGASILAVAAAGYAVVEAETVRLWEYSMPGAWFSAGLTTLLLMAGSWCAERFHFHSDWCGGGPTGEFPPDGAGESAGRAALIYAAAAGALAAFAGAYAGVPGPWPLPLALGALGGTAAAIAVLTHTGPLLITAAMGLSAAHLLVYAGPILGGAPAGGILNWPGVAVLAALTYVAGLLWERFVHSFAWRGAFSEHAAEALPAFAATSLLLWKSLSLSESVLWQTALAAALALAGGLLARPSLLWSALGALAAATGLFFWRMSGFAAIEDAPFYLRLGGLLAAGLFLERMLAWIEQRLAGIHRFDEMVRTLIVASAGATGVLALNRRAGDEVLTLSWAGLAVALMLAGLLLREGRHRWAAALIGALALLRFFFHDLGRWPVAAQAAGFAASVGLFFALFHAWLHWLRSRRWSR